MKFSIDLLKNKDFLILWIAQVFTELSLGIMIVGIAILADEGHIISGFKGLSLSVSLVIFFATIPAAFTGPIAGVFSDWFDKKKIMLISNFLRFLLALSLLFYWDASMYPYVALFFMSIAGQFFFPAEAATLPLVVKKKDLLLANTLFAITIYSATIIGVFAAGVMLNVVGAQGLFVVNVIMLLLGTILLMWLPSNGVLYDANPLRKFDVMSVRKAVSQLKDSFVESITYIKGNRFIANTIFHLFLMNSLAWTLLAMIFRLAREIMDIESRDFSFPVIIPGIIGLVMGLVLMNRKLRNVNRPKLVRFGVTLFGIAMSVISIGGLIKMFDGPAMLVKVLVFSGIFMIGFCAVYLVVPAQTMLNEEVDQDYLGRVYGLWLAVVVSLATLPPLLLSIIADQFTDITYFLVVISILIVYYSFKVQGLLKRN